MTSSIDILTSGPFARTMLTNFFFFASLNGFVLLPALYPALSALLIDVTPDRRRGSAVGTFSSVVLTGNALGAMAFGYVAHGLGYRAMWSALALLLLCGFLASVRLDEGRRGSRGRSAS